MFYTLSKTLDVLLSPLVWVLLLLAAAVVVGDRRGRALAAAALLLGYALSTGFVSNLLAIAAERPVPPAPDPGERYDVAVVLGGMTDEVNTKTWGHPSYTDAIDRLVTAHAWYAAGRVDRLLVTGGRKDDDHPSEAEIMADQLAAWGVPRDRVLLETEAHNTRENAVFAAAILEEHGLSRVLVVTSARHGARALGCFRAVGVEADFLAVDHQALPARFGPDVWLPRAEGLARSEAVLRELAGRVVYRLRGWSAPPR